MYKNYYTCFLKMVKGPLSVAEQKNFWVKLFSQNSTIRKLRIKNVIDFFILQTLISKPKLYLMSAVSVCHM